MIYIASTDTQARAHLNRSINRSIIALALPALGALIAEPLFLAIDTAMIGHLGANSLAGLAIASAILTTAVGLMIFLSYSTTPIVARLKGAGDMRAAVQAGVSGVWVAAGIGILLAGIVFALSDLLILSFGAEPAVAAEAASYLKISSAGIPAMLIVFAATGLLRGLHDTLTPLLVSVIGFAANAALNWFFIFVLEWGIAGSAVGTVVAQWGMVLVYLGVVAYQVREFKASIKPVREGFGSVGRIGMWLFVRSLGLRAALVATVVAATSHGAAATAGYQIIFILVSITAFGLDSLAIAAQTLVGDALGASDAWRARYVMRRTMVWGLSVGVIAAAVLMLVSPYIGNLFTNDPTVLFLLHPAVIAVGATLPLAGVVYVLDGVLIGAGDARYLAIVSFVTLALYLPALWAITVLITDTRVALVAITLAFTLLLMGMRAITLGVRALGDRWVVLGRDTN